MSNITILDPPIRTPGVDLTEGIKLLQEAAPSTFCIVFLDPRDGLISVSTSASQRATKCEQLGMLEMAKAIIIDPDNFVIRKPDGSFL